MLARRIKLLGVGLLAMFTTDCTRDEPRSNLTLAPSGVPVVASAMPSSRYAHQQLVNGKLPWQPYSPSLEAKSKQQRRAIFIRIDADWDISSAMNASRVLDAPAVKQAFVDTQVLAVRADFTNESAREEQLLKRAGRNGVPGYFIVLPEGEPLLLPPALTPAAVIAGLNKAAALFPPPQSAGTQAGAR